MQKLVNYRKKFFLQPRNRKNNSFKLFDREVFVIVFVAVVFGIGAAVIVVVIVAVVAITFVFVVVECPSAISDEMTGKLAFVTAAVNAQRADPCCRCLRNASRGCPDLY